MIRNENRIFLHFDFPAFIHSSTISLNCIKKFKDDYIIIGTYHHPNDVLNPINFLYIGHLSGYGKWYPFNFENKKYKNIELNSFSPCNICNDFIRIVGNVEIENVKKGFLYNGNFKSDGKYELIIPLSLSAFEIEESVCKSISDNYIIGTYKVKNINKIESYIYNIAEKKYNNISYDNYYCDTQVNCIIKNSKYCVLCGTLTFSKNKNFGYIAFWNIKNNNIESWYKYQFTNDKQIQFQTFFNSISHVDNKFNIVGNYINENNENKGFISKIKKISKNKLDDEIHWYDLNINENRKNNINYFTTNSIHNNIIIGTYKEEGNSSINGYISIMK